MLLFPLRSKIGCHGTAGPPFLTHCTTTALTCHLMINEGQSRDTIQISYLCMYKLDGKYWNCNNV